MDLKAGFSSYKNGGKMERPENMRETLAKIAVQKEKQAKISRIQLRYYGACSAMTGLLSANEYHQYSRDEIIKYSFNWADSMLAEFDRQLKELDEIPPAPEPAA